MKKSDNYLLLTKREIEMIKFFIKYNLAIILIILAWAVPIYTIATFTKNYRITPIEKQVIQLTQTESIQPVIATSTPIIIKKQDRSGVIREVTAYNAGDPLQTDSTPCDGAGGNICEALEKGQNVCAANFVPLKTWLRIDGFGDCQVLDRMASKFSNRVDIAMKLSEHDRAINFGKKNLFVEVLK